MHLKATDAQGKNYRVFLNGRLVPYAIEANEEDGWVLVNDTKYIGMIAPISQDSNSVADGIEVEPIEIPTKKLFGVVKLQLIPLKIARTD